MDRMNTPSWLLRTLRPYSKRIALGLVHASCAGAVATIDPLLMRHLIDVALPQKNLRQTTILVIFIALSFVGRTAFGGLSGLASFRVTQWLGQDLRSKLLVHMTTLSADWHERTMLGEKLSRIDQDVEQIAQYGADIGNTVFRTVVFFVVNLAITMALNCWMTVAVLPLLPLFLWVRLRFREKIQSRADHARAKVGKATGDLAEHLGAVSQIQILGAEEVRIARTVGAWLEQVGAQWEQRRTEIAFSISVTNVLSVGIFLVFGLGAHEFFVGALSIGGLVAFYAYVIRIFEPVSAAMELSSLHNLWITHSILDYVALSDSVLVCQTDQSSYHSGCPPPSGRLERPRAPKNADSTVKETSNRSRTHAAYVQKQQNPSLDRCRGTRNRRDRHMADSSSKERARQPPRSGR